MTTRDFLNAGVVTATGTGTGDLTLGSPVSGNYDTITDTPAGETVDYYINDGGSNYEVGNGVVSGGVLTRNTVYRSSNAGAKVDWAAGEKTVAAVISAEAMEEIWASKVSSVDNISALMTTSITIGTANVLGFYAAGDGGGGVFYYDSAQDKANHNGGTIIDPDHTATPGAAAWYSSANTGTGCWMRHFSGVVDVKWFGAKGDGVIDDTNAVDAAQLSDASIIAFSDGTFLLSTLVITKPIRGEGGVLVAAAGATIYPQSKIISSVKIFDETSAGDFALSREAAEVELVWFGFFPNNTATLNTAAFDKAVASCVGADGAVLKLSSGQFQVNTLEINKSSIGLQGAGGVATWICGNVVDAPVIRVTSNDVAGYINANKLSDFRVGMNVTAVAGNCGIEIYNTTETLLRDIRILPYPQACYNGISLQNAADFSIDNMFVSGCLQNGVETALTSLGFTDGAINKLYSYSNGQDGLYFNGFSGIWATNVHVYGNDRYGVNFVAGTLNQFLFAANWIVDTSADTNIIISNLNRSSFSNLWVATQQSTAVNTYAMGFYINNADVYDIGVSNARFLNNNLDGVRVISGRNIRFENCNFGDTLQGNGKSGSGSGIRIGDATEVYVTGCRAIGNTTYGIIMTNAASDYCIISLNNARGNTEGSLHNDSTGAHNIVLNNIIA